MTENPQKLDDFEMDLLRRGYEFVTEKILPEEIEPSNHRDIYTNIKPLYNSMRHMGFSEDTVIRIRFIDNKYVANIFKKQF